LSKIRLRAFWGLQSSTVAAGPCSLTSLNQLYIPVVQSKFSSKAYKLTIPQIKQLCDFFNIDRSVGKDEKPLDKEALVDRLLDFLGAPSEKLLAAPIKDAKPGLAKKAKKTSPNKTANADGSAKKKKRGPNKKTKTKKAKGSDDEDEEDDASEEEPAESEGEAVVAAAGSSSSYSAFAALKNYKKGEQPSDDVLREWVRAYIACFNMETSTAKHAIKTASEKFGLDLTEQKEKIKEMLTDEM
jgi:hypothetical protein